MTIRNNENNINYNMVIYEIERALIELFQNHITTQQFNGVPYTQSKAAIKANRKTLYDTGRMFNSFKAVLGIAQSDKTGVAGFTVVIRNDAATENGDTYLRYYENPANKRLISPNIGSGKQTMREVMNLSEEDKKYIINLFAKYGIEAVIDENI